MSSNWWLSHPKNAGVEDRYLIFRHTKYSFVVSPESNKIKKEKLKMKAHQTLFVSKDRALVFGYWESYFSRWAPECDACFHDSLPNNSEHRNFDSRKGPRTPKVLLWKHLSFCLRSGTFHLAEITRSHNQSPRHEIVPGMISSAEIAFDS